MASTGDPEARRAWNETIRTGWKAAIDANKAADLTPAILQFERHLMAKEAKGKDYFSANSDQLDVEVFWESGYSNPQTVDLAKAESIALWAAERRKKILGWARASEDEAIRAAAEKLSERRRRSDAPATTEATEIQAPRISRRTAAERTLFYRRVLGAWAFLLAMNERPALARMRELTELESVPLPRRTPK